MTTNVNTPMSTNRRLALGCLGLAVIFLCVALAVLAGVLYSRTAARTAAPAGAPPYIAPPTAAALAPVTACNAHGQMAGSAPNNGVEGAPLGGAYENCAIVAQVWGSDGLGYVVVLAPHQWIRLQAQGLAAWLIDPSKIDEAVADSVASIEARGEPTPTVVRMDLDPEAATKAGMPGIVAGPYTGPLTP